MTTTVRMQRSHTWQPGPLWDQRPYGTNADGPSSVVMACGCGEVRLVRIPRTTNRFLPSQPSKKRLDPLRLAQAIQSTILTSLDKYMGPGGAAYRKAWDDLTEAQQRHVLGDAEALADAYADVAA